MRLVWTDFAIERVSEIAKYIAQDNPKAAEKWVDAIFDKAKVLKNFPKIGRMVPEILRDEIREIVFKNYRIIYKIQADKISILTVRHFKQVLPITEIEQN